jgi:hypothetical protein
MGEVFTGFWLGSLCVRGKITLRWTSEKYGSMGRTGFGWFRKGSNRGFCEQGNETSGSIKEAGYF